MPPQDEQAERFCLGYAMLLGMTPLAQLEPRHFFFDANRIIFEALRSGAEGPHGVAECLKAMTGQGASEHWGKFLRVGGGAYLAELVLDVDAAWTDGKAALALHASACAESVREMWKRRIIREACLTVASQLSGGLNSSEAWKRTKEECDAAVRGDSSDDGVRVGERSEKARAPVRPYRPGEH